MPQNYKILGQSLLTPNTLTNVYVTGASTSAVVNSIFIANQDVHTSNVEIVLRPINEELENKHTVLRNEILDGASTYILNLGITVGPNTIIAANITYSSDQLSPVLGISNASIGAFGLEIT